MPRVAIPLMQFFVEFLKANQKVTELDEQSALYQQIGQLTQLVISHFKYPNWFIEMGGHTPDPDDFSDGRIDEQKTLRELHILAFGRLCCLKPI